MKIVIFRMVLLQILDNNGVYKEDEDIWKVNFIRSINNSILQFINHEEQVEKHHLKIQSK